MVNLCKKPSRINFVLKTGSDFDEGPGQQVERKSGFEVQDCIN